MTLRKTFSALTLSLLFVLAAGVAPAAASGDSPIHPNDDTFDIPLIGGWLVKTFHLPAPLTRATVWMTIVAAFLVGLFAYARRGGDQEKPSGLYNLLEAIVVFIRDEIAMKNIGHHHGRAWTPYLLTTFVFIYASNMVGLIPGTYTVTANINVTAVLALMTLLMMQLGGIRQYGVVQHFKNLVPDGIPGFLLPVMVVVEIMGVLAKPFALAVRLFANMTAGHVIITSLLLLITTLGAVFTPVSIAFSLFIFLLELLVAFLQAYIFTMLTSLFIGMSVHVAH